MKRTFDIIFSLIFLLLLLPFFLLISLVVKFSSPGPVFFRQLRVGLNGSDFYILKFRTMFPGSDRAGLLTVGGRDHRITRVGYFLRKYKIDELPQFINVLFGDMSVVGPRPEVRKYVEMYSQEQLKVLNVKPGITDYASVLYSNESELLAETGDPEKEYISTIMPAKLKLNLYYIEKMNFVIDIKIILSTLAKIVTSRSNNRAVR